MTFIGNLISENITTEVISAVKADIQELVAGTITTDELKAKWAQIDGLDAGFADIITANIGSPNHGLVRTASILS